MGSTSTFRWEIRGARTSSSKDAPLHLLLGHSLVAGRLSNLPKMMMPLRPSRCRFATPLFARAQASALTPLSQAPAQRPFVSGRTSSARFSSRTGPKPKIVLRFFENFKGICEGDRTSETGERPKIGLESPFVSFRPNLAKIGSVKENVKFSIAYDFGGLAEFVTVLSPVEKKWASTRSRRSGAGWGKPGGGAA